MMRYLNTITMTLLLAVALVVTVIGYSYDDDSDDRGRIFTVNCNKEGQTITKALRQAQPGDTIRFKNTCRERVNITKDQLTLVGHDDSAVIDGGGSGEPGHFSEGLVNIVGVQGVMLAGFTVRNSPFDGINGRQGAAFTVKDIRVLRSADDGIEATETSTVRFLGTCEVRGAGDSGISITHGSSTRIAGASIVIAENAVAGIHITGTSTAAFDTGTVRTTQNLWGILAIGHTSLTLSGNRPTIVADANTLDGILVADTSNLRLDGGMLTAAQNEGSGILLGSAGLTNFAGTIVLQGNNVGIAANGSFVAHFPSGSLTTQNNTTTGIIGDSGSDITLLGGATITNNGTDIVLSFDSLGTFEGNTIGTMTCDVTSIIRGDTGVTCPTL